MKGSGWPPGTRTYHPTAVQAVFEEQDMSLNPWLPKAKGGNPLAVGRVDQLCPFHCSANGNSGPFSRLLSYPTARQAVFEPHDTPISPLYLLGLRVRWTDHRRPFQCSANVTGEQARQTT